MPPRPGLKANPPSLLSLRPADWWMSAGGACISTARRSPASQPTVILESGIGDFSVEWSLVQPGTAGFARVCSYDRAGDGWSDVGPHPRTMHQIVLELHTLLNNAG